MKKKELKLFKPLLEFTHSIVPPKLFRYRSCSEKQFDALYNDTNNPLYSAEFDFSATSTDQLIAYKQLLTQTEKECSEPKGF